MSIDAAKLKLQEAGIEPEQWLDLGILQFAGIFHRSTPQELAVYYEWTKQQDLIVKLLSGKIKKEIYTDKLGISKHAQFENFKEFVTPLVFPVLKQKAKDISSCEDALSVMSFTMLLQDNEQDQVQDIVVLWLEGYKTEFLSKINTAASDQVIYNEIHHYLTENFWKVLNAFNKRHYRVKAMWMELLTNFVRHQKASKRLVQAILLKLTLLEVNQEHRAELNQMENDVRTGRIVIEKNHVPWKRVIILSAVCLVLVLGITWLMYIPAEREVVLAQDETSFMELSQKERNELDSLLDAYKQKQTLIEQQGDDHFLDLPPSELITINSDSKSLFWTYYKNWSKHEKDQFALHFTSKNKSTKILPKTNELNSNTGKATCAFTNESKMCALVIVFDELNPDYMWCQFVQPGDKVKFSINPEVEKLVIVPGGEISKKLALDRLPFEQVNEQFFQHLDKIYTITEETKFKLVYKDFGKNGVVLIDLNKVLML